VQSQLHDAVRIHQINGGLHAAAAHELPSREKPQKHLHALQGPQLWE